MDHAARTESVKTRTLQLNIPIGEDYILWKYQSNIIKLIHHISLHYLIIAGTQRLHTQT